MQVLKVLEIYKLLYIAKKKFFLIVRQLFLDFYFIRGYCSIIVHLGDRKKSIRVLEKSWKIVSEKGYEP